ncbi:MULTISPECIES: hypothetical protein [Streptomyces]|uniref:Uncharacterized protein n=1 Tax=Streptomyces lienomycini TaxID=284035 RepID=A0ABV9WTJ4_9ACTN|nr:hypothetical protein [Streptomyces sp. NBC_00334]
MEALSGARADAAAAPIMWTMGPAPSAPLTTNAHTNVTIMTTVPSPTAVSV